NFEIWALLTAATLLQPRGVPGLTSGFLPLWLTDLTVGLTVALNLIALGGALGALGPPALARVLPHAPLELGGYFISVVLYLRARRGALAAREGVRGLALAGALLACGAFVESYVSGSLV
ncbi:MAG TPA: hypothetical protein VG518_10755, partial [Solirubrobacterales bacterium]|nr:hypothetical protein [Solirubrobacterales bacterium]